MGRGPVTVLLQFGSALSRRSDGAVPGPSSTSSGPLARPITSLGSFRAGSGSSPSPRVGVDRREDERLDLVEHDEGPETGVPVVLARGTHENPLTLDAVPPRLVRERPRVPVVVDEESDPVGMACGEQTVQGSAVVLPAASAPVVSSGRGGGRDDRRREADVLNEGRRCENRP